MHAYLALAALHRIRHGRRLTQAFQQFEGARDIVALLRRIRRCCFVLYDPQADPQLGHELGKFQHVRRGFGASDSLLLVPVDPPRPPDADDVRNPLRSRGTILPGGNFTLDAPTSRSPSATARCLAAQCGVPAGMGPVVVVVDSLAATGGWMIATSASMLERQLRVLMDERWAENGAGGAGRGGRRKTLASESQTLELAGLSRQFGMPMVWRNWGLPLDVLMLVVIFSVCLQQGAGSGLSLSPDAFFTPPDPDDLLARALRGDSEQQVIAASAHRTFAAGLAASPPIPSVMLPTCGLTADATRFFSQGDDLMALIDAGSTSTLDYRSPCLHWGLAAEHELADALGHDVRASLGVRMPENLWKVQPGLDPDSIDAGGQPVSFNRADRNTPRGAVGRWQPPPLGMLRAGWKHWYPEHSRAGFKSFTDLWARVNELRNACAHPSDEISRERALQYRDRVVELIERIPGWRRP